MADVEETVAEGWGPFSFVVGVAVKVVGGFVPDTEGAVGEVTGVLAEGVASEGDDAGTLAEPLWGEHLTGEGLGVQVLEDIVVAQYAP